MNFSRFMSGIRNLRAEEILKTLRAKLRFVFTRKPECSLSVE